MSAVWISSMLDNHSIFDKPGLREKYFGEDWAPATHVKGVPPQNILDAISRHGRGFPLGRSEMIEAAAVFDERRFKRAHDLFAVGGFYAVKGQLAELLSRFDLGDGGFVPLPFYKADLVTPYGGDFFILNFGARKNSFLPEQSRNVAKFSVVKATGLQTWKVYGWHDDGDVALSPASLDGPDLWFEEVVYNQIFVKDELAQALIEIGMADVFKLKLCRIVDSPQ